MSLAKSIQPNSRLAMASLAGERQSPLGLIGSALLHAGIIGATLFTFAHKLDIAQESAPVVPVEVVTIADKTNLIATVKAPPKVQPKEEEPTPPQPQKLDTPPPQPEPKPEKLDVAPEPKPEPPPQAEVAPEPKPTPPPPLPKVKLAPAPEAKAETPKKEEFDINKITALLDKRDASQASSAKGKIADKTIKGFGAQNAMTMDLQDSLRSQIQQCWSPPVGAPHPAELVVEFELFLKPDGSVAQPPQLSGESESGAAHDTYTRAAAEAARRAIYTCAPYKLPKDRYSQWQDITLTFDPRQMVDQ
jgi:outer membrane biosynthesis protein TonB